MRRVDQIHRPLSKYTASVRFHRLLSVSTELDICEIIGVGQKDNDAIRMVSFLDGITIECHDDLAGLYLVAFSNLVVETFAVHSDGVNTDVDQDFHACCVCKADRVLGISNGSDLAVERSKYNALSGVDALCRLRER